MIEKKFQQSLDLIEKIKHPVSCTAIGGADFLEDRQVQLAKTEKSFKLSFKLAGSDRRFHESVLYTPIQLIQLKEHGETVYIIPANASRTKSIKESNENSDFDCFAKVDSLHTKSFDKSELMYYRVIIPLQKDLFSFHDYEWYQFSTDLKKNTGTLLKVSIELFEYHFFYLKVNDICFIGIDALQPQNFQEFQKSSLAIQTAKAFIDGCFHLNEAFYITSKNKDFDEELNCFYTAMRESLISSYNIFTTNAYSVKVPIAKREGKELAETEMKEWLNKLVWFKQSAFKKLAELFHSKDSLSMAAFIILEANNLALELKAAAYCVAYEAICHELKKNLTIPTESVMEKEIWSASVKPIIDEAINELFTKKVITEDAQRILLKKVGNLNQPTNRDSLTAPFNYFGYSLKQYESKAIDNRNKFLHGSTPVLAKDENSAFKELYFNAIIIHKLAYILLLKMADFSGYIINYAKLHEDITGHQLNEDVLIFI